MCHCALYSKRTKTCCLILKLICKQAQSKCGVSGGNVSTKTFVVSDTLGRL